MKKKVFSVIFITACLLCCVIPFAGMIVAGSLRQTTFAPVREQAPAPDKADSPLITGSLGLFSASSPPVDEEPNFNLRKKKKMKKQLKL